MCIHRQISRDFNSWIFLPNTPLANTTASTAIAANCTHQRRKSVGSLMIIAAGSPTTQLMIFLICLFFAAIFSSFAYKSARSHSYSVEYPRLLILTNGTWLLIIPSQLSVFAVINNSGCLRSYKCAERKRFLASFLRQ